MTRFEIAQTALELFRQHVAILMADHDRVHKTLFGTLYIVCMMACAAGRHGWIGPIYGLMALAYLLL